MEEIKFYDVKVGHSTKRGGFNAITSFVCKSNSSQYIVQEHYRKKYKGLDILITEVVDVEEVVINNDTIELSEKQKEINEVRRKLEEIKTEKRKLEDGVEVLRINKQYGFFSKEVDGVNDQLIDKMKEWDDLREKLEKMVKLELIEKYKTISSDIRVDKFNYKNGYFSSVDFNIFLHGKLITILD